MDGVPLRFVEDVAFILSQPARSNLCFCEHVLWRTGATKRLSEIEHFDLHVWMNASRLTFGYIASGDRTVEEIQEVKYPRYSSLRIRSYGSVNPVDRDALRPLFNIKHVEIFTMREVSYFDSYFPNFWPNYVNHMYIHNCKFNNASTISAWLKSTLKRNDLKVLSLYEVQYEGAEEDMEDDLFNTIMYGGALSYIAMLDNVGLPNITMRLCSRLLHAWTASEHGFTRNIQIGIPSEEADGQDGNAVREEYFRSSGISNVRRDVNVTKHKSGKGSVHWARGGEWMTFRWRN
ncbi:hypothetical protein QR680_003681 [Steinernema hermaphroditum]|uniref:Uncharacterized protein n=1 Tax=Steinernema hermaphroditum TaxID=289476 RepID=A0AA39HMJ5_9BILA|nr:hypothetical protein QR680_003681 [Steinernema hermaphroditum]